MTAETEDEDPQRLWSAVEDYLGDRLLGEDALLTDVIASSERAGLPAIQVSPPEGRFLALLVRLRGARSVLEIGTLGGYSAICMGRALPPGGRVVTLELSAAYAALARHNAARAGLAEVVEVRIGPAAETLAGMVERREGPFDLVFIDADKKSTPLYFERSLALCRKGSVIVVDNVVRGGSLIEAGDDDADAAGMRRFLDAAAAEPRVDATVLQTVGSKGYDGFAFVLVTSD